MTRQLPPEDAANPPAPPNGPIGDTPAPLLRDVLAASVEHSRAIADALSRTIELLEDGELPPEARQSLADARVNLAEMRETEARVRARLGIGAVADEPAVSAAPHDGAPGAPVPGISTPTRLGPEDDTGSRRTLTSDAEIDRALADIPKHVRRWHQLRDATDLQEYLLEELYAADPGSALWDDIDRLESRDGG